ncbi:MAG TPA: LuxR C-terminal-related transcriptional regulator, partial [Solirubrobacterales bacterium]|nr:LuxR C-terminal-related transcriptional regulator [Solirubrobacterales bacterium]
IDWSYELLDDAERALFRRLAVFSGGFDYEAVKAVCGGGPVPDEPLGILTALVDKSLVAAAPGAAGKGRYRLLETIREYAAARLSENREAAALQEAHARHFLALAEEAAPQFFLGEQVAWMRRLRPEADNFRAALEWSREAQPPVLARLAAALRNFWYMRGQYAEGRQWLGAALEAGIDDAGLRSRVLRQDGMMAWRQGDFMFARHRFEEALELERRGHDQIGLVAALGGLGFVYFGTDDFRAAAPLFEEALALARQSGDQYLLADALQNSGILALQLGNLTEAHTHLTGSLEIFSRTNDVSGVAYTSQLLALVLTQQGDLKGATRLVDQAIKNQAELGDTAGFAGALLSAAELAAAQRRPERAMLLEGAAQQRLRSIGSHLPSLFQASRDRWLAAAQQRLGARVRPLLEKGARLDDEQVARLVLSGADDLAGIAEHGGDEPLSRRELEVAELLASGLTNRQISSKLHLSERTVDAHAEHIRGKLGVRSRAQIAAWVMQRAAPRA